MANYDRYTVTLENPIGGGGNQAQVGFSTLTLGSYSLEFAMQLCVYFGALGSDGIICSGTKVTGIQWREHLAAGAVDVPFDAAMYVTASGVITGLGFGVPAMTDYGDTFGVGDPLPIGTSVNVAEFTGTLGRKGRGRHFIPFASKTACDSLGAFGNSKIADLTDIYNQLMLNMPPDGDIYDAGVGVAPASGTNGHPITSVVPRSIYSNLRTRRR